MELTPKTKELLQQLEDKFGAIGQNLDTHLEGLLHATPITYWDYIQTDALLNLQTQRTNQPDEMVFIMYHQVNELLFKMLLWEIEQAFTRIGGIHGLISDNYTTTSLSFTSLLLISHTNDLGSFKEYCGIN